MSSLHDSRKFLSCPRKLLLAESRCPFIRAEKLSFMLTSSTKVANLKKNDRPVFRLGTWSNLTQGLSAKLPVSFNQAPPLSSFLSLFLSFLPSFLSFFLPSFLPFCFLGPHPQHMEVPRLGASLHHSHSNKGSKPCLRLTPQLRATLDPLTH